MGNANKTGHGSRPDPSDRQIRGSRRDGSVRETEKAVTDGDKEKPTTGKDLEKPTTGIDREEPVGDRDKDKPVGDREKDKPVGDRDKEKPVGDRDKEKPVVDGHKEKPVGDGDKDKLGGNGDRDEGVTDGDKDKSEAGRDEKQRLAGGETQSTSYAEGGDLASQEDPEKKTQATNALTKGIHIVTMATEEDKKRNYAEAIRLYEKAVEYFLYAIKYEAGSQAVKDSVGEKSLLYLERAERLRKYVVTHQRHSAGDEGFADQLSATIVVEKPNVRWNDVAGLSAAKTALTEAAVMPVKFPHLFTGQRKPIKTILLYGPSGTGKSYLAKAVATEANGSTFFSVSASDLLSKYRGESEKLVRTLFDQARAKQPSVVFMDEIDALCWSKSNRGSESESSRIKSAFLLQLREVCKDNKSPLVLCATNLPWTMDIDFVKRFEKRLCIPLPDVAARRSIFQDNLASTPNNLTDEDFSTLAERTERYSGADISLVVRDALMQPVRKAQSATHFRKVRGPSRTNPDEIVDDLMTPCSPCVPGAVEMNWADIPGDKLLEPIVSMHDLLMALSLQKPSVSQEDLHKFATFTADFGQG